MVDIKRYFRGQGKLEYAERNPLTGAQTSGYIWVGNVTALTLALEVGSVDHFESHTGQSLQDVMIETTKKATGTMTMEDYNTEVLARFMYGTETQIAAATVTAETVIAKLGQSQALANIGITTWTSLTNSAGTTTYTEGTDYTLDRRTGMVKFLSGGTITQDQSLRANYAFGKTQKASAFTSPNSPIILRFNGLNTVEADSPVVIDVYKFRFTPLSQLPLIGNEISNFEVRGTALYDDQRADSTADGRFFRVRELSNV